MHQPSTGPSESPGEYAGELTNQFPTAAIVGALPGGGGMMCSLAPPVMVMVQIGDRLAQVIGAR
jgi:hypothetical protein